MNTRGQAVFYLLMIAVVIIILALSFSSTVSQFVDTARSPSNTESVGLDCANTTISDFDKANCMIVDLGTPYFFYGLLALAGIVIGAKLIFGG